MIKEETPLSGRERLNRMIDELFGGSARAFSEKTGVSPFAISRIRSGEAPFKTYIPRIMKSLPEVSSNWLREGIGEMMVSRIWNIEDYKARVAELEAQVNTLLDQVALDQKVIAKLLKKK